MGGREEVLGPRKVYNTKILGRSKGVFPADNAFHLDLVYLPGAPTGPYAPALRHTVPQIIDSLRA